ncbi:MAG: HD family phosphohydrolase [Candidatus Cryptobacteroides sp.]
MGDRLPKDYRVYIPLTILFVLLVLLMPRSTSFNYKYSKGSPWMYETLVAEFDFPILKTGAELLQERNSAEKSVIPYYKKDSRIGIKAVQDLNSKNLDGNKAFLRTAVSALNSIYQKGVVRDEDYFANGQDGEYDWTQVYLQTEKRAVRLPAEEIYSRSSAILELQTSLSGFSYADSLCRAYGIYDLIVPDLKLDEQMSATVHLESIPEISPTKGLVEAGQVIVSNGEIVTSEIEQILNSYKAEYDSSVGYRGNRLIQWLGNALLAFALVVVIFFTIQLTSPVIFTQFNKYTYLLLVFFLSTLTASWLGPVSLNSIYLVPFPLFAYYLLAFFRKRLILPVYMISLVPLLLFARTGVELFVMHLVAGTVSIYVFRFFNKGWLQFINALIVFVVLSVVWFSFRCVEGLAGADYWTIFRLFVGSLVSVAFYPLIYLFEKIFNLVSTSRLMELSDTNNKALRELAENAPGTFQHSLQVANFAGAAARSIGADEVLVRTAALYHDIGKSLNPLCFVENEQEGEDYHKNLDPKESARSIIRHVSDGLLLADKYKLPGVIKEFITTHHGTTRTAYFYNTYVNSGGNPEDVEDFMYPGPRPSTREQVVLMVCDALEAASRTLKDKSPKGISELVDRILLGKFQEKQFNESEITIKELTTMSETLKEYIQQVYHARVVYPKARKNKK